MDLLRLAPGSIAFPIVAALVPDAAEARAADAAPAFTAGGCYTGYDSAAEPSPTTGYGDDCTDDALVDLGPVNAEQIPVDGVLVLQATYHGGWTPALLAHADVFVSLDGDPVAGALELTDLPGWLVWRPQDPWTAGATLHFGGALLNPDASSECGPISQPVDFDFTIAAEPGPAIVGPTLVGSESVLETPIVSLETLACCPGVAPELFQDKCTGASSIEFDPQQCTPIRASGVLSVDFVGTPAVTGPAAKQFFYTLDVDGSQQGEAFLDTSLAFTSSFEKPICAILIAHDVASGINYSSAMACFGIKDADKLGTHAIDPPDDFTCSLRQCEVTGNGWDLETCTPLDPDHPNEPEPDSSKSGCGCNSLESDSAALLALAGLLLALRRRR